MPPGRPNSVESLVPILSAGAGVFAVAQIVESHGKFLGHNNLSAEMGAEHWSEISDMKGGKAHFMGGEQTGKFFERMSGK